MNIKNKLSASLLVLGSVLITGVNVLSQSQPCAWVVSVCTTTCTDNNDCLFFSTTVPTTESCFNTDLSLDECNTSQTPGLEKQFYYGTCGSGCCGGGILNSTSSASVTIASSGDVCLSE